MHFTPGNLRGVGRRRRDMKFRLVAVIVPAAILVAACGPGRSTTTLPKLPVEASPGGAASAQRQRR